MVQIKKLVNGGILNNEWVGFQGDSEFIDSNDELQMGYWNFKSIADDCFGKPYSFDDVIEEELIYGGVTLRIKNSNGNICIVELHYIHNECKNCKHDYQSYHCMGCQHYYGNIDDLEPLCNQCEHTPYEDACDNCVWNMEL